MVSKFTLRGDPKSYLSGGAGGNSLHRVILGFPVYAGYSGELKPGDNQTAFWRTYINPEQIQIRYPIRAQVIQTVGGVYFDSYGSGVPTGSISGTFGFGKDIKGQTGIQRLQLLRNLYNNWLESTVRTVKSADCSLMIPSDDVYFYVYWGDLEVSRAKSSPFLVNYTLSFTVIKDERNTFTAREYKPPLGPTPYEGGTPVQVIPVPPKVPGDVA